MLRLCLPSFLVYDEFLHSMSVIFSAFDCHNGLNGKMEHSLIGTDKVRIDKKEHQLLYTTMGVYLFLHTILIVNDLIF